MMKENLYISIIHISTTATTTTAAASATKSK